MKKMLIQTELKTCTGLYGNCTGLSGDLDKCQITEKQRRHLVSVSEHGA